MADKMNYKELCERVFDAGELVTEMLVYTGRREDERPVFKVVTATEPARVKIGGAGKVFWGIVGYDPQTEESEWYNYNDCVSLEDWAVLDRLLKSRFGWMELLDPGLVYETRVRAKIQLAEGK